MSNLPWVLVAGLIFLLSSGCKIAEKRDRLAHEEFVSAFTGYDENLLSKSCAIENTDACPELSAEQAAYRDHCAIQHWTFVRCSCDQVLCSNKDLSQEELNAPTPKASERIQTN